MTTWWVNVYDAGGIKIGHFYRTETLTRSQAEAAPPEQTAVQIELPETETP